ncbi:MAG: GPW/gp25 family protein [Bacteroides sp.]|nr:GPW/gp25 family protein [Bacteroides sp.]
MEQKSYLGTGWSFPPVFDKQQGVLLVSDEEDIRQSLILLFSTVPGERLFRYDYGCDLRQWVFGEVNLSMKTLMAEAVQQAIRRWEPRVETEQVEIDAEKIAEGMLRISVSYFIPAVNSRRNMVYPYYFREGTNL